MSPNVTPMLTRAEWQAVSIALKDADHCGRVETRPLGRLSRLWTALTGNEPPRPLADPRLEALRRYVCAIRRRARQADAYVVELLDFGFNRAQLDAIRLLSA